MKKQLIVHIGANKTGSSSIQHFLWTNRSALRAAGVIIPGENFDVESNTRIISSEFEPLLRDAQGAGTLTKAIRAVAKHCPDARIIVLSAENLAAHPAAPSLFEHLLRDFEIEVKLYIRRQDEYILSSWQQWYSKVGSDFWAWTTSVVDTLGDWRKYIENWEAVVPRANISVRVFERAKMEAGDVVMDFYKGLGVEVPLSDLTYEKREKNLALSDVVMDLVKGNKLVFDDAHDRGFYQFVRNMTGDRYMKSNRQSSITLNQRQAIISRYARSNGWVQKNYFPVYTTQLFTPPKESDFIYIPPESAELEKLEFIVTLLYRMYRERQQ